VNQWYFPGTYERSCFGSSMEALVHISLPIREIPVGRLIELVSIQKLLQWISTILNINYSNFISIFIQFDFRKTIKIHHKNHIQYRKKYGT